MSRAINMSLDDLRNWQADPRHRLASSPAGWKTLEVLAAGPQHEDHAKTVRRASAFFERHVAASSLFGQPVSPEVPISKRHIALRNWGHDPALPSSPVHRAHRRWLGEHGLAPASWRTWDESNLVAASQGRRSNPRWIIPWSYLVVSAAGVVGAIDGLRRYYSGRRENPEPVRSVRIIDTTTDASQIVLLEEREIHGVKRTELLGSVTARKNEALDVGRAIAAEWQGLCRAPVKLEKKAWKPVKSS